MQVAVMTSREAPSPSPLPSAKRPADKAFDTWLKRGLHDIYDEVAREPVPDDLIKLIQEHREK